MKVGTDGVLLGAWGSVSGSRILDIGTGSGLIALMAAQRNPSARVVGIDVDEAAVSQAQENISRSPFQSRVVAIEQDVLTYAPTATFDAILCNPPFFTEDTPPSGDSRILARWEQMLPFPLLVKRVRMLLSHDGDFSVILPSKSASDFISLCMASGLHLRRRCQVRTVMRKPPRRTLMSFTPCHVSATLDEEICLMDADGNRSQAYRALTNEFYL